MSGSYSKAKCDICRIGTGPPGQTLCSVGALLNHLSQSCVPLSTSGSSEGCQDVLVSLVKASCTCCLSSSWVYVTGTLRKKRTTTPNKASMSSWVCPTGKNETVTLWKLPDCTSHAKKAKTVWFLFSFVVLSSCTCNLSAQTSHGFPAVYTTCAKSPLQ